MRSTGEDVSVQDVLALTPKNDAAYVPPTLRRHSGSQTSTSRRAGLDASRDELADAVGQVDWASVLEEIDVDVPRADVGGGDGALLDTRRGLIAQLRSYKDFDMRYE